MSSCFPLCLAALLCLGLAPGCQKAAESTTSTQKYEQLPEATNVLAALDQKNYEEALAALVKVKQSASTEAQQNQFFLLNRETGDKLREASASDPKAAEAVQAWRMMNTGR